MKWERSVFSLQNFFEWNTIFLGGGGHDTIMSNNVNSEKNKKNMEKEPTKLSLILLGNLSCLWTDLGAILYWGHL